MVSDLASGSYIDGLQLSATIVSNITEVARTSKHASKDVFVFLELVRQSIDEAIAMSKKELDK